MTKPQAHVAPLIAVFLPRLSAGGAERVLLALVGEILRRGYRCDLVTAQSGGRWAHRIPLGARYLSLESTKPLHSIPRLMQYLRRERPSVLLSSVFSANVAAIVAASATNTRCVLREAYRAEDDAKSASTVATILNRLALRWLYRRANAIIALSKGLARHIIDVTRITPGRVFVIPNPHLPPPSMPEEDRATDLILACGRLEPQKDFSILLQAFAIVRKSRPARLVVLGEGSQLDMLQRQADELGVANDVEFPGYAENVHQWMRRAKVFVSTSRIEGFPNVLLEALVNGCAVVSTESSDAVPELLDGGRLGTIVPVGDAHSAANGILAAMTSHPAIATDDLIEKYDVSSIVDQYLKVLAVDVRAANNFQDNRA
jgi:glycosyltransferase involved in cell wall biosynthesis